MSLLTISQAADYLQMNPQVVRRWLREKKLPGLKIGREWRIDEKDLAALIEEAKASTRESTQNSPNGQLVVMVSKK